MSQAPVKIPMGGHGLRSLIAASFDLPKDAGVAQLRALLTDGDAGGSRGRMRAAALDTIQRGFPLGAGAVVSFAGLCLQHGRVDMLRAAFEMKPPAGHPLAGLTMSWMQEFGVYWKSGKTQFRCIVHLAVERNVPESVDFIALALAADPHASDEAYLCAVHEHAGALFTAAHMRRRIENAPPPQKRAQAAAADAPAPARRRPMV